MSSRYRDRPAADWRIERVRQPDGQYRWFSTSKVPIRDAQGRVTGLVGIGRDMTERMEAEEKIRESEEKYRSLVSNIPDVIWTIGADMRFAFISPNIERVSGFKTRRKLSTGRRGVSWKASTPRMLAG